MTAIFCMETGKLAYKWRKYNQTPNWYGLPQGMPTFVGNSVRQNLAGTVWKAFIYVINWDGFLKTKTSDGNLIRTIEDDACIQGCRPEYVSHDNKFYLATADYGNKASEVNHADKLAAATNTSQKGLLYKKFTCSPFVQNLHFMANKNILVLIQNQIEGRKWRLTFLDFPKSIDQGHEVVVKVIDTDKADELEGFSLTDNELKGIAVSSAKKDNMSLLDLKY